jgi:2,3-bisphosphoglycerate-dependent phosphoglycerate mutase
MELLLIRHGLPVRRELEAGVADPELSEAGLEQAQRLAAYLEGEHLDAVYASPLKRAFQTAEPVAASRSMAVIVEPDVAEFDRTSSEYVPIEELKATNDPRWQAMMRGEWEQSDQTPEEFQQRLTSALERLIAAHNGQRIAVVCHGGVINGYLAHILRLDNPQGFFYPNYTSIHRVAAARSGERTIVTVNETAHLRGSGLPIGLFQKV